MAKRIRVSGKETIDRISRYYELITSGKNVGPSTDKDVFSYRFQYESRSGIFKRMYDIEIADFPGEYSDDLASNDQDRDEITEEVARLVKESYRPPYRRPEFYLTADENPKRQRKKRAEISLYGEAYQAWVAQADEYIVVADLDAILQDQAAVASIQAKLFSAILSLKEASVEGGRDLSKKNVALVFSKSDIISSKDHESFEYRSNASFLNSGDKAVEIDYFSSRSEEVLDRMSSVVQFLRNNFAHVEVMFHSSYGRDPVFLREEEKLINFILP